MTSRPGLRRFWRLVLLPLAAVAAAAAVRPAFLSEAGNHFPWVTFLPAVTVAAAVAGALPGLVATAASLVAVTLAWPWFSPEPFIEGPADRVGAWIFALNGLALAAGGEWLVRARERDRRSLQALQRSADALRASEERYRLLAENAHDVIWTLDLSTMRFTYVSPSIRELRGVTAEEALAEPMGAALTPESFRRVQEELAAILSGAGADRGSGIYDQPCKDGSVKHVEINTRVIRDAGGVPVQVVGVSRDATARVEAERALARSAARLHAIAHSFPNGSVALFDAQDRVLVAEGSIHFLGLESAKLVGLPPHGFAPPEIAAKMVDALSRARRGETVREENRIRGRAVETVVSPVTLPGADPGMCVMVSQDVTGRRRMEAQLAATSRLASLGTLVAGVAHEINNPLGAMLASDGYVAEEVTRLRGELRGDAAPGSQDVARRLDRIAEALADAQEGGRRVERIVKDLALFGRPDARRARVRLANVVDEALRWLPSSVVTRANLRREDLGAPEVTASEGQLVQVVVNLITNAAHAIPDGRRGEIAVRIGRGGPGMARLEVRDDGVGMTPELADRIFDPFFTTREVGEGTGLGLAVVHSIVTAHGGTVTVASTPGQGTTIGIEIPAAA